MPRVPISPSSTVNGYNTLSLRDSRASPIPRVPTCPPSNVNSYNSLSQLEDGKDVDAETPKSNEDGKGGAGNRVFLIRIVFFDMLVNYVFK